MYTLSLLGTITIMIQTRFLDVERNLARGDVNRVIQSVRSEQRNLAMIVQDYSFWDDTWRFVQDQNPDYIRNNIDVQTFKNIGIQLFTLYDVHGFRILSYWFDGRHITDNPGLCPVSIQESICLSSIVDSGSGFISTEQGVLMIETRPVTHTDGSGPSVGWLIMGRLVTDQILSRMYEQSGVFVERSPGDTVKEKGQINTGRDTDSGLFEVTGTKYIHGYIRFMSPDSRPALVLLTRTPRTLRAQGVGFISTVAILFSVIAIFMFLTVNIAYRFWISLPLSHLETVVDSCQIDGVLDSPELKRLHSRDDEIGHVAGVIREMNERIRTEHDHVRELNQNLEVMVQKRTVDLVSANTELEIFRKIIESTSEAIIITDLEGNIFEMNDAMCAMTGYTREELIGKNSRIFQSGRHNDAFYRNLWKLVLDRGHWEGEIWDRRKDGCVYPKWQTINTIRDDEGNAINFIGVSTDISVIKEAEERLNHLAYYDPLTSLPNRMLFADRLEHQIACARRNKSCFGLLFIDLDRFKHVNDSLGHLTGDSLLIEVAERLKGCIRSSDTLCRIGGDEFTLLLQDLMREENAGMVASQIVHKMSQRFVINGSDIYIGASVGIALFPKDGIDSDILLRKADAAMYLAKESGRGVYRYSSGELEKANKSRLEIEARMHRALERNEYCLHYQPQVVIQEAVPDMNIGLIGVEALIRWEPEPGILINPGEFLPVAEETGFIAPLGDWVLLQACRDAKRWFDMGKPVQVSVNVAARQLESPTFIQHVASVLETTGLPSAYLKLELTESGFMRNITHASEVMARIRDTGVTFAIDDFGTGYSSLNYINRLPVDCLKIDQSFVQNMDESAIGGDIVSAIISMAHAFGLVTIAEGVETCEQLEALKNRGCDIIQGYLVSRPLPVGEFERYLTGVSRG